MKMPKLPTGGDFNKDGYIDLFCDKCGCGFIQYIHLNGNRFSKRKVKELVDKIFTRKHLPYNEKKEVLKELFQHCNTKALTVEFLAKKFDEEKHYLLKNL